MLRPRSGSVSSAGEERINRSTVKNKEDPLCHGDGILLLLLLYKGITSSHRQRTRGRREAGRRTDGKRVYVTGGVAAKRSVRTDASATTKRPRRVISVLVSRARAHTTTFIVYCAIPWRRRWRQFSFSLPLSPPGKFNRQTTKRHSGQAALACAVEWRVSVRGVTRVHGLVCRSRRVSVSRSRA